MLPLPGSATANPRPVAAGERVQDTGIQLVDKAGVRYNVLRDPQTKGFWTYPTKDLDFCGIPGVAPRAARCRAQHGLARCS